MGEIRQGKGVGVTGSIDILSRFFRVDLVEKVNTGK